MKGKNDEVIWMNYEPNTIRWRVGDIVIHDFDEDENYELFVDTVIILDYRG